MVVGWQNSAFVLNVIVKTFNVEYLKEDVEKDRDTHQPMREIAIKKLKISSLFELKPQLDKWYKRLDEAGLLNEDTVKKKRQVGNILKQVYKYKKIRNCALHFGDMNDKTNDLIDIYEHIQTIDLALLNRILTEMIKLGYLLRNDACRNT